LHETVNFAFRRFDSCRGSVYDDDDIDFLTDYEIWQREDDYERSLDWDDED
jgi:hypothetical protein